ncbi:MAG: hypothetical protein LBJ72_12910 [Dysgonamonadaceae bacterium]|jgi:hypothetical protein|nr:hypothetical protein [Dysgonamonadaceae bacterium]
MINSIRLLALFLVFFLQGELCAQNLQIEELKNLFGKGKPLKLSGGISANSVFNAGNETTGNDPFTYYLNGNINLNIYGQFNLPFSFSLTNSGTSYRLPSSPNRISIHPSYKWITGHIGDVSMSFSPYTMNGHLFTGAGVELTPDGWEFAALYGRFQKAVGYEETQPSFLPTYKRTGYGFKAGKTNKNYRISINLFEGKDEVSSLISPPDSLGITPMQNLATSINFVFNPVKFIELSGEYGFSLLTSDIRAPSEKNDGISGLWYGNNMSTTHYNAFKFLLNYVGETSRFGIGYERIDPDYKTLGAYYFTNDLENITVNGYQSFWKNKINFNVSLGLERDDLANKNASATSRIVGSLNLAGNFSERVNANLAYTNFQTYTNLRSDFELINQEITLDKLDSLNYVQLSQSLSVNLNLTTKKTETELHNLNLNVSYQDAANKQGNIYRPGSVTEMINASTSYLLSFVKKNFSVGAAVNLNNSRVYNNNSLTWGPTLNMNSRLFRKKVSLSGSASYNMSQMDGMRQSEVFLVRLNSAYSPVQRHNITLAYSFQWRNVIVKNSPTGQSLLMLGYSCNF